MNEPMTWNQFKAQVDHQLAKQDLTGDEPVWYIDVHFPREVEIVYDANVGVQVT